MSKLTEFVCLPSTRPHTAGSERCLTARQILSKLTEFVCPVDFNCRYLPAKLTSRFQLPIFSRQIDESISTADFFPLTPLALWIQCSGQTKSMSLFDIPAFVCLSKTYLSVRLRWMDGPPVTCHVEVNCKLSRLTCPQNK